MPYIKKEKDGNPRAIQLFPLTPSDVRRLHEKAEQMEQLAAALPEND